MYSDAEIKAIHEKMFTDLRIAFAKEGRLQKTDVSSFYTTEDKETLIDFGFSFRPKNELVYAFSHKKKPQYKNPLNTLVMGEKKKTPFGKILSMYAEPFIRNDLAVIEVGLEAVAKNRFQIWVICQYYGSDANDKDKS